MGINLNLLLVMLPFFQFGQHVIPHLGLACLTAYLKQYGYQQIDILDLRTETGIENLLNPELITSLTSRQQYVHDIYELPLLISLAEKFQQGEDLEKIISIDETILSQWALERDFLPAKIKTILNNSHDFILKRLKLFQNYDVIGFSLFYSNLYLSVFTALVLKKLNPRQKIIFGGPHITQSRNIREFLLINNLADAIIVGEGEQALLKLLDAYRQQEQSVDSPGIVTLRNLHEADKYLAINDLNTLPAPDYSNIKLQNYAKNVLQVYASRGCTYRCNFCSEHSMFGRFKFKEPEKVVQEMLNLKNQYKRHIFHMGDSLLNFSNYWLEEFCDLLISSGENIGWYGYLRAQLTTSQVKKLKKAGLLHTTLGVESFSPSTLVDLNKKKISRQITDSIAFLVENKISTIINLIIASPQENEDDFMKTFETTREFYQNFQKHKLEHFFKVTARNFQLQPMSEAFEHYENFGIKVQSWHNYTAAPFPEKYTHLGKNTLATFALSNIPVNEILHRLFLLRQLSGHFEKNHFNLNII